MLAAKNMAGELWLIYVVRTNMPSMLKNKSGSEPFAARIAAKIGTKELSKNKMIKFELF